MDFQKFVAWGKLPSVVPPKDAIESSASSSKSGSGSEDETESEAETKPKVVAKIDSYPTPKIEIPPSVKHVLDKLDMTQLERAKKEVSKKLGRILDHVNRAYEHYKRDDDIDPDIEKEYLISQTWEERSRRSRLLDHIASALDDSMFKAQELQIVLESFKAWNEMLKTVELSSKVAPSDDMIDEMEECLLKSITSIEANVQHLIKLFRPLLEEKTKPRRKSAPRTGLFRAWRDKVADEPQAGEPLTTEQMLEDEPLTLTRSQDVNNLILEMADSSLFHKTESVVIKYIATMVENITKAFSLLTRQCRNLKIKCENITSVDNRKQDPQVVNMQRELRMVLEKKAALEMQIQNAEERCKVLLITNEMMQRELRDANERAMVVSKVSFSKTPSGKHLTKSDRDKEARSKRDEHLSTKHHAVLKKVSRVKAEEEESLGEQQQAEGSSSVSKKDKSLTHLAEKPQDSKIKWDMKAQEKDTLQEVVLAEVSADKSESELAMDAKSLEKLLVQNVLQEKERRLTDKLKAAQDARERSKFSEWKKLQTSILVKAVMHRERTSPGPPEQSTQASTQAGGKSSQKSLIGSAHDIKCSSPELELPPLPTQDVATIRVKETVEFLGDNLGHMPLTAPGSKEKCDAEFPDKSLSRVTKETQAAAIETEDADQVQAQKQLIGRLKETQEKEETRLFGEKPADVPQPKQVEKAEDAVRGLGTKLQETARERGGVEETRLFGEKPADVPQPKQVEKAEDAVRGLGTKLQETARERGGVEETRLFGEKPADVPQPKQVEKEEVAVHGLGTKTQETARERGGVEETRLFGEMPADVPQPKQVEKEEDAVRGLGTKLQETARERGGVEEMRLFGEKPADVPQPKQVEKAEDAFRGLGTKLQETARERGGVEETRLFGEKPADVPQPKQVEKAEDAVRGLGTKLQETARERGGVEETRLFGEKPADVLQPKQVEKAEVAVRGVGTKLQETARERGGVEETRLFGEMPADVPQPKQVEKAEDAFRGLGTMLQETARERGGVEETRLFGEKPADVPQPKQVEKAEDAFRGLGTKLQEIARERGGVIDAETIKDVFEELDITYQDTMPGQVAESHPVDKLGQVPTVKRSSLRLSTAEQASKKEKQSVSRAQEAPSGQDACSALQEFQTAILACLEDKLEKSKKGPPGSSKRSIKLQPIERQAQQFFQAIDRKLEECLLMKLKATGAPKRQRWVKTTQSKGKLQEEKETRLTSLSTSEIPFVGSQVSLASSVSLPGIEQEQPTTPEQPLYVKPWQEQEQEEEQMREAQQEVQYQKGESSQQDEFLPKLLEEEEDLAKASDPKEEEPSLLHLPDETGQQVKELWQDREEQREEQLSEEQEEDVSKGKEPQQKESESEMDEVRGLWHLQLQEQLEEEKKRLKEEQERLQQERRILDEEEEYMVHWQQLFQAQREQWEQQQQQQEEQKHLWQVQLEHWHHLRQENEEQDQYWEGQRQQQKEQQHLLQEDIQRLQREYEKHLKLQGELAEEEWHWSQLRGWHEEQQHTWQEEDKEQERKKSQWQEQLVHHEEQMQALQQEQLEQQQQYKKWQQEQQERQQELERLWEKRWQEQLKTWHRQMQQQRVQQRQWQVRNRKLQEKQQQMPQVEKPPAPKLKVVGGTSLDQGAKPCRVSPTSKHRHISTTPELTPSHSTEYEEDDFELETTWFPKLFSKAVEGPGVATTQKRYTINVEAQRKNLELLREASKKADISPDLYTKAKETINQALHNDVERLALLFQKYTAFCHLQEARRNLTIQLDAAKEAKDSAKIQHLYKMVEKMDAHKKKVMGNWTVKQNAVEKKRQYCFEKMIAVFAELRLTTKLRLSNPSLLMIKAQDRTQKETMHMPHIGSVVLKRKVYQSPLTSAKKPHDLTFSAVVRAPNSEQIESLWKTDITELSIPLGPKVPVSLLWSEAYGFPDIPRFLELDISSVRKKPLQNIRTRIQNIPRWKLSGYNFMHL